MALLRKETCKLEHPIHLCHPVHAMGVLLAARGVGVSVCACVHSVCVRVCVWCVCVCVCVFMDGQAIREPILHGLFFYTSGEGGCV